MCCWCCGGCGCCCCCCHGAACATGVVVMSCTECTLLAVPVDERRAWLRIWIRSLGEGAPPVAAIRPVCSLPVRHVSLRKPGETLPVHHRHLGCDKAKCVRHKKQLLGYPETAAGQTSKSNYVPTVTRTVPPGEDLTYLLLQACPMPVRHERVGLGAMHSLARAPRFAASTPSSCWSCWCQSGL